MKTVKSALLGSKNLIDTNQEVLLVQLREIIKEHRALIIDRLVGELPIYLDFKFQYQPDKDSALRIKEELMSLKNSGVGLQHYESVVSQLMNRAVVHLTNEPFYQEIDQLLASIVQPKQLKFA
jgi:hypothetical protein